MYYGTLKPTTSTHKMTETRKRVKLFILNSERQWEDKGAGYLTTPYVKQLKGISLTVVSEVDGSQLLQIKIQPQGAYQRQQDTLIVWSDEKELALSFQEEPNCEEVWKIICRYQGKDSSINATQDIVEESEDDKFGFLSESLPQIDFPHCGLCSLKEVSEIIANNMHSPMRREKLASTIENEGYIEKLLSVFRECEDLEYMEGLHYLNEIFNNIFLLNKTSLCEEMLQEHNIFEVIGCLEYEPSSPTPKRYRQNLSKLANYRQVIPITNKNLLAKIHQTFRIQYIQDVILPISPITENNVFSSLSNILVVNKLDIVAAIQDDDHILSQLFTMLCDEKVDEIKRTDLILFLRELFSFAQCLQSERESFCRRLSTLGIFQALEMNLNTTHEPSRSALIDILNCVVEFSSASIREYISRKFSTNGDNKLMKVIISIVTHDSDPEQGSAFQVLCILRAILDPESALDGSQREKIDFVKLFYQTNMNELIAPLLNIVENVPDKNDFRSHQHLGLILDFLTFCVESHVYHIQNYVLRNDLLKKTLVLLESKHLFVALGALKFMRKIIGQLDETYNHYILKGNLFAPVVMKLITGRKNNVLGSAILEMFHFIGLEGSRKLCHHIVENYWEELKNMEYANIFRALKMRYDSCKDEMMNARKEKEELAISREKRCRREERGLEEEVEKWLNEDDDRNVTPNNGYVTGVPSDTTNTDKDADSVVPSSQKFIPKKDRHEKTSKVEPKHTGASKLQSCKRSLVDYDGDSEEEDELTIPPMKRAKQS